MKGQTKIPWTKIDDHVTIGPKADEEMLREIRARGFGSVFSLCRAQEADASLSPGGEGQLTRAMGLDYKNIPVPPGELRKELVDQFCSDIEHLPPPVYVHSDAGQRSGALGIIYWAVKNGVSGDDALKHGESLGLELDEPAAEFVRSYVETRRAP